MGPPAAPLQSIPRAAIANPERAAAKRAFEAMMQMGKIDSAAIEAAHSLEAKLGHALKNHGLRLHYPSSGVRYKRSSVFTTLKSFGTLNEEV